MRFVSDSLSTMAPHLSQEELNKLRVLLGKQLTPADALKQLNAARARRKIALIGIDAVRRASRGTSHAPGTRETRGRKAVLGKRAVRALNSTRQRLIKQARGERGVHWKAIITKARVAKVHRSTAKRAFDREGLDVEWRRPREKPVRTPENELARVQVCSSWAAKPVTFYTDKVDLIIDNKKFDVPTHDRGRQYTKQIRVRGHLRSKAEGLKPGFVKPGTRKNRMNTGGFTNVCAGISGGKVVLWHYLEKRWNGDAAAHLFSNIIPKVVKRIKGHKAKYLVMHDNDPTGYMSKKGVAARSENSVDSLLLPPYSPDLNPCDFYLWNAVMERFLKEPKKGRETVASFKARLRKAALSLPRAEVLKAVAAIKARAQAIIDADGKNISMD